MSRRAILSLSMFYGQSLMVGGPLRGDKPGFSVSRGLTGIILNDLNVLKNI